MQWREFLETARRLAVGTSEGDWRSAVSRAYYAIFHSIREWLLAFGIDLGRGGQAHSSLYLGLSNCGISAAQSLANRIDALRTFRTNADYDLWRAFNAMTAQSVVSEADSVNADFQALLRAVPPQQIADGAKNYLISIGRIRKTP